MLFFASLVPYATNLFATNFHSTATQALYGSIIVLMSVTYGWSFSTLEEANKDKPDLVKYIDKRLKYTRYDVLFRFIGVVLTLTVLPIAASIVIIISSLSHWGLQFFQKLNPTKIIEK